jgi:hypothetical protein
MNWNLKLYHVKDFWDFSPQKVELRAASASVFEVAILTDEIYTNKKLVGTTLIKTISHFSFENRRPISRNWNSVSWHFRVCNPCQQPGKRLIDGSIVFGLCLEENKWVELLNFYHVIIYQMFTTFLKPQSELGLLWMLLFCRISRRLWYCRRI